MNLTTEEWIVCREHSKKGKDGKIHCSDCPLVMDKWEATCKANCTKEEWEKYDAYQKHKGIHK